MNDFDLVLGTLQEPERERPLKFFSDAPAGSTVPRLIASQVDPLSRTSLAFVAVCQLMIVCYKLKIYLSIYI